MDTLKAMQQARLSRDPRFDGRFFIAVKTTKIFCRPVCPANLPQEKNVEYFQLAQQAMHAGYRPCLRCRPDSAPGSYAWLGNNTTAMRALTLIKQHPQLSISALCEKLGIGERYLRRLFQDKVGISPKQYQLFERLLFAKKLLHESGLSIEDVAHSSGFNSARSLQFHFQKWLQLKPSAIKKSRPNTTDILPFKLSYQPPYNWPLVRDFLDKRAIYPIESITETSYTKHFRFGHGKGYFIATHNPEECCFEVKVYLDNRDCLMPVITNIRRILDLDVDTHLVHDKLLSAGISADHICSGLRLPGVWDPFEAACRAILGQQISVSAAIKLVSKLAITLSEGDTPYFPTPEQIANSDLLFLGMPQSRRQTLIDLARFCINHPNLDVTDWIKVKGIGPWTVQYAQLRGLSEPDIGLFGDLIVKQQLAKCTVQPERCAPWRSYLTLQLWQQANQPT